MTIEETRDLVALVMACGGDLDTDRPRVTDVYVHVIKAIAAGAPNARELAAEALKLEPLRASNWP